MQRLQKIGWSTNLKAVIKTKPNGQNKKKKK